VVVTNDPPINNLSFYIDGTKWTTVTGLNNLTYIGTLGNLSIGRDSNSSYWNGTIDEVKFFNRALNFTEIAQLRQDTLYSHLYDNTTGIGYQVNRTYLLKEDFDGTTLNTSIWTIGSPYSLSGSCQPSNSWEIQNYNESNIEVTKGTLIISAYNKSTTCAGILRNFTGGQINSRNKFSWYANTSTEVIIEIKFMMELLNDNQSGIFPAFWSTCGNDTTYVWPPEVDYFELKGNDNRTLNGIWIDTTHKDPFNYTQLDYINNWNTLKIYQSNNALRGYLNGEYVWNYTNSTVLKNNLTNSQQLPMYLRINFALYDGYGGTPVNELLPYKYVVDYVYVYTESSCIYTGNGDFMIANVNCTINSTQDVLRNKFIIDNSIVYISNNSVINWSERHLINGANLHEI
jgi:beta-glucanase (GH16 family)